MNVHSFLATKTQAHKLRAGSSWPGKYIIEIHLNDVPWPDGHNGCALVADGGLMFPVVGRIIATSENRMIVWAIIAKLPAEDFTLLPLATR